MIQKYNLILARSRLTFSKRKLTSNPTLLHEYHQIMKDYVKNNIIEEVNEDEVVRSAHYLPHHAVIKSEEPLKHASCSICRQEAIRTNPH